MSTFASYQDHEPLGRDKFGRLIYADDNLIHDSGATFTVYVGIGGATKFHMVIWPDLAFQDGRYRIPLTFDHMTVDLAGSPKRSNFERYFADLAPRYDFLTAFSDICDSTSEVDCYDGNCVFRYWCDQCGFLNWLNKEATI